MFKRFTMIFLILTGGLATAYACEMPKSSESATNARQDAIPSLLSCASDADCTAVSEDCCDCRHGGKQKAINNSAASNYNASLSARCSKKMCPQVISSDQSCQGKPTCHQGECRLK